MATINGNKRLLNVSSQTFFKHKERLSGSNEDINKDITRSEGRVSWVKTMVTPTLTNMCRTTNRPPPLDQYACEPTRQMTASQALLFC